MRGIGAGKSKVESPTPDSRLKRKARRICDIFDLAGHRNDSYARVS